MPRLLYAFCAILFGGIFILALCSFYKSDKEIQPVHKVEQTSLSAILEEVVADNNLPSLAAAIISEDGIVDKAAHGVRKDGEDTPVSDQDKFHLGSCTKAMTAVLTAMLIDDGLISWNTTIQDVFPDLSDIIHPDFHQVDVYELLTHTSGIAPNSLNMWAHAELDTIARRLKIIIENIEQPAPHKRGEFLYANLGYMMVGCMLEKITGKTWEALMQERVFSPLDMNSAGFGPPSTSGELDQPWGHSDPYGTNNWSPVQFDNPESLGPAGSVHCNIEDWGKFISFQLLQKDNSLLSQVQRDKLLQVNKENYAPGWRIVDRPWAEGKAITHAGSNTMNFALAWVAPNIDRAYLVLTNSFAPSTPKICDEVVVGFLKLENRL